MTHDEMLAKAAECIDEAVYLAEKGTPYACQYAQLHTDTARAYITLAREIRESGVSPAVHQEAAMMAAVAVADER